MKKNRDKTAFGARDKIGYLFGDFGCNMSFQLIQAFLFIFITQGLRIGPAGYATIILIAKIFDAINDPIIGALVDLRKPGKYGKFKPWIFWGALGIALTTTLLFVDVGAFPYWGKFFYVLIMYMVWSIAYTTANVPYGALNSTLTDDPSQRASLSSLRSIGAGFAMLPIMVLVPLVVYGGENNSEVLSGNFVWVALVASLVGIGGFLLTLFLTRERVVPQMTRQKFNYWETLKGFFTNRAIIALCIASFAQIVFIMSYSMTVPLVMQFYFKNGKMNTIANIALMIPMILVIPFMAKLNKKFGSKAICTWPNLIGVVFLFIMLFIDFPRTNGGAYAYLALYMIAMLGGGTFMLATWSMVADCVDAQEVKTGRRDEASVYATYSLSRKIAQGVGGAIVSLILGAAGYKALDGWTKDEIFAHNSKASIAKNIKFVSIILPLIGFALVFIVLLLMYNLSKEKVEENTKTIRAKRATLETYIDDNNLVESSEIVADNSSENIEE